MCAVALPVAVVAEVDAVVCALGEAFFGGGLDGSGDDGGGGSREDGGEDGEDGGREELHLVGCRGFEVGGGDLKVLLREAGMS